MPCLGSVSSADSVNSKTTGAVSRISDTEGTATHFSIPAGRIPGQRNLVGYVPWGHKRSDRTDVTIRPSNEVSIKMLNGGAEGTSGC